MTRLASSAEFDQTAAPFPGLGILTRLRRHFASIEAAHAGQARLTGLQLETLSDTGLTPDDLTGAPSYDPNLPFFMQANFGLRNL